MTRPLGLALALATAFGAWELCFAGFMADDLMQLGILEGVSPAAAWTGPFDLYTLSDGNPAHVRLMQNAGLFPWFAPPAFEMAFLRPLSSATLVLDHALFGLHPAGYRLDGALWSIALVAAVGLTLRRALPGRAGAIALLVFVLSGIHGVFCWSATRHVVIAAALGFAALAAHLRWREDDWWPGAIVSAAAIALSLAASEVGVAVAAYVLAYEMLGASGTLRTRLRALLPAIAVVAAYVVVWLHLGRGVSPGSDYIDPLRQPGTFLLALPARLAVLVGGMITGGNVDLWVLRKDFRSALVIGGALAGLAFAGVLRAAWPELPAVERRAIRWLGAAAVASAIPFAGTPLGSRCLVVPFAGGAAVIGVLIHRWWTVWRNDVPRRRRVLAAACATLAVVHLVFAPLGRLASPGLLRWVMADRAAAAVRGAELDRSTLRLQTAVVLVAPDLIIGLHGAFHGVLHRLPMPAAWRVLSWAPARHRFVRTASDTLVMTVGDGGLGMGDNTFRRGAVVPLRAMEARVLAVGERGPSRVRLRFDRSLDDPTLTLLAWSDGRLRRVAPPPVGGRITIPFGGKPRTRRH